MMPDVHCGATYVVRIMVMGSLRLLVEVEEEDDLETALITLLDAAMIGDNNKMPVSASSLSALCFGAVSRSVTKTSWARDRDTVAAKR
jgi:hypothetical protein